MKFSITAALGIFAAFASALPVEESFSPRSDLVARANDYPYSGKCDGNKGIDPWNYYRCQCTSFVAYRLNKAGVKFTNQYKGHHWGNANTWNEAAKASGVKVNNTPKVGSVAQTDAGSNGHVAWVVEVGKATVKIEEYNYAHREKYGTRVVPKSDFRYIHVKE